MIHASVFKVIPSYRPPDPLVEGCPRHGKHLLDLPARKHGLEMASRVTVSPHQRHPPSRPSMALRQTHPLHIQWGELRSSRGNIISKGLSVTQGARC